MSSTIHPTAIIDPGAAIGKKVTIGPYAVIENNAVIGDGCEIGSHVLVACGTTLGKSCRVFHGSSIGTIMLIILMMYFIVYIRIYEKSER